MEEHILLFEWDENKNQKNQEKHNIPFIEATSVFKDSAAISDYDPDHSDEEERWITIGRNNSGNVLVISHTFRQQNNGDEYIRIISVRKATKREEMVYYER